MPDENGDGREGGYRALEEEMSGRTPYGIKWHMRVDHTLFGFQKDDDGLWVDGLLQSIADVKKAEQLFLRVGLPFIILGAISVCANAIHGGSFESLLVLVKGLF